MKKIGLILFIFLNYYSLHAQTDREFWFVAPAITRYHPGSGVGAAPVSLNFTSMGLPANITISQPANEYNAITNPTGFVPIQLYLPANTAYRHELYPEKAANDSLFTVMRKNLENKPPAQVLNKGIHITSDNLITVYYEVEEFYNTDIFSLKGRNALGTEFFAPFQTANNNGDYNNAAENEYTYSAIDVVAIEDNTTFWVYPTDSVEGRNNLDSFTITLNKGQTYSLAPKNYKTSVGRDKANRLSGTRLKTVGGKKIAVTIKDDSIQSQPGGCRDTDGDQLVPLMASQADGTLSQIVGREYIVMKGNLGATIPDRIFILGTQNFDTVTIAQIGLDTVKIPLSKGQTIADTLLVNYTYVKSKHPIYIHHVTGAAGCEIGGAILPSIEKCSGSSVVGFSRKYTRDFYMNIMVRKGAEGNFTLTGPTSPVITAAMFTAIPGTNWSAAKIIFPPATMPIGAYVLKNNKDIFHLGIMNGDGGGGGNYGFFSDFNEVKAEGIVVNTGDPGAKACYDEPLQLFAKGGVKYEWKPATFLNDPFIASPIATPKNSIKYTVFTYGACNMVDSAEINLIVANPLEALFYLDTAQFCAPHIFKFNNQSIGATKGFLWYIDSVYYSALKTPPGKLFTNTSDTVQTHIITLYASNEYCTKQLTRKVFVYPSIQAAISATPLLGCSPIFVNFTNNTTGHEDTVYLWDFGDGGSSSSRTTTHTYNNIGDNDTTFTINYYAVSPFQCRDTASLQIKVSPFITAGFTVDTVKACALHEAIFYNTSFKADSFFIDYGDGNQEVLTTFNTLTHQYQNTGIVPTDHIVQLITKNTQGCVDTLQRMITIYPQVIADFVVDTMKGCDSVNISFTNQSIGHELTYRWDFGNGNSSININPSQTYVNKDTLPLYFDVELVAESKNLCRDTHNIVIEVFPYIKANFAVNGVEGCSPFNVTVENKSKGVETFNWNFGDGSISTSKDSVLNYMYQNPSFSTDSIYTIRLDVVNKNGCVDSLSRTIKVYPSITSKFTPNTIENCDPAAFKFQSGSQGASFYLWNFSDGATSTQPDSAAHEYARNNDDTVQLFKVSLFVMAANNTCTAVSDTVIRVNPYNRAIFAVEKFIDCPPFNAVFDNNSFGATNTYKWYIDNIQVATAPSDTSLFSHLFNNPVDSVTKTFEIKLIAENTQGCTSIYIDSIAVYPQVKAGFSSSVGYAGCHPFTLQLSDTARNKTSVYWSFGDNSSSVLNNPSKTYNNFSFVADTIFIVKQIVESANCKDSISKPITVFARPKASFQITNNALGCPPLQTVFANTSKSTPASNTWIFGDGLLEINNAPSVSHEFQNLDDTTSTFTTKLIVETTTGCADSVTAPIIVLPYVKASFMYDSAGCSVHLPNFINTSINGYQYSWSFGDGKSSNMDNPFYQYVNTSANDTNYLVRLITTNSENCKDTVYHTVTVYPKPIAAFNVVPFDQFYNPTNNEAVVNLSHNIEHRSAWNYAWNFGQLKIATNNTSNTKDSAFVHIYNEWGPNSDNNKLYISLIVNNPNHPECIDTSRQTIYIIPPTPEIEISGSFDSTGCSPLIVNFQLSFSRYGDSIVWDFDDGTFSTEFNPTHVFQPNGYYFVKATIYGDSKYPGIDYKPIIVYPNPEVIFDVDPKNVQIPRATIQTFNKTKYANRFLWEFGDGNSSSEKDPRYTYTAENSYDVKLTAYGDYSQDDNTILTCETSKLLSVLTGQTVLVVSEGFITFPTAFQPSAGYPINTFRPIFDALDESQYLFQIYNRWGERIFETKDIKVGWDGKYNGRDCKQDVYVWKVKGKKFNGEPYEKVGNVTIIR